MILGRSIPSFNDGFESRQNEIPVFRCLRIEHTLSPLAVFHTIVTQITAEAYLRQQNFINCFKSIYAKFPHGRTQT